VRLDHVQLGNIRCVLERVVKAHFLVLDPVSPVSQRACGCGGREDAELVDLTPIETPPENAERTTRRRRLGWREGAGW
jgi:hypothetical protein